MQLPLHIAFRGVTRSDEIEAHIRQHVAKLERVHPRIVSCRVQVGLTGRHQAQGRQFEVDVAVRMPGQVEIVSNRHHDEEIRVVLRNAFEALARSLDEAARERRGDVKTHTPR